MDEQHTKKLIEDFPQLYRGGGDGAQHNLMCFGFECGDGWFDLLYKLSQKLDTIAKEEGLEGDAYPKAFQVKEKFGCYDEQTEVLTSNGWKFFKDCTPNDQFATLQNGEIVYYTAIDTIAYEYDGPMYQLVARGVDLLVTPNHNMYWARGNSFGRFKGTNTRKYDMELSIPEKRFRTPKRFLKTALWKGNEESVVVIPGYSYTNKTKRTGQRMYVKEDLLFDTCDFLALLGIIISGGYIEKTGKEIGISACNDGTEKARKEQMLWEQILNECQLKYTKTGMNTRAVVYRIYNKVLGRWCVKNIKCGASHKQVPMFVKTLTSEHIRIFLTHLFLGDGYKAKSAHTYYTVSKQLSDDVQELILKEGSSFSHHVVKKKTTNRCIGNYDCHCINWLSKTKDFNIEQKTIRSQNYIEQWVHYHGMVYCVTVPNNVVFVRRNGKGVWCGNSLRFYFDNGVPEKAFEVVNEAEGESYKTCEVCGKPGTRNSQGYWVRTVCEEHARREEVVDETD